MHLAEYSYYKDKIRNIGFDQEYRFIEERLANPCNNAEDFSIEYIWVVLNSGMKYQIASRIFAKVVEGLNHNIPLEYIFNHKGKVEGIKIVHENREEIFSQYLISNDPLNFLGELPWIGEVTKYHLARNLGENVCKPDRHLVRISNNYNKDPFTLCNELSEKSGDLVGIVDFVLWSCGNQGLL